MYTAVYQWKTIDKSNYIVVEVCLYGITCDTQLFQYKQ